MPDGTESKSSCVWFCFVEAAETPVLVDMRYEPALLTHSSPGVLLAGM